MRSLGDSVPRPHRYIRMSVDPATANDVVISDDSIRRFLSVDSARGVSAFPVSVIVFHLTFDV